MKFFCGLLLPVLLLTTSPASVVFAQTDSLHFEHLTERDGLSQNSVISICQDREGFMWFGTLEDGLNKYDGYSFTVLKADPNDPQHTLRHNGISNIYEDPQGRLWVGTWIGLHLLDKRTGKITAFLVDSTRNKNLTVYLNMHFSVFRDPQGLFWLGSGGGISRFDPTTKKITSYPFLKIVPMRGITKDSTGRFWVGSFVGLYQFEPKTGKFTPFSLNATTPLYPSISALYLDAAGILWIGTEGEGMFRLDTRHTSLQAARYDPNGLVNKSLNMNGIYEDADGTLWLATTEGLQRIDQQTNVVTTYRSNPAIPGTLSSNDVLAVYKDRTGNLWVGTDNGINKVSAHPKPFYTYQIKPTSPSVRLYENSIQSVLEDQTGTIWLGTAKGLYQLNANFQQIAHLPVNPADVHNLSSDWVESIYEDSKGRLWVGTQEGLQLFHRATGKFTLYPFALAVGINYNNNVAEDAFGKLWQVGGGGIACFDPNNNQYTYYQPNPKDPAALKDRYINGLMVSRTGDIWVATATWGASRLNPTTGKFTHYRPNSSSPSGHINDKCIFAFYEDPEGIIWVGALQGGLNRFDPKTNTFSYFTTREGLPSNNIVSITGDEKGNLWIATSKGLSRFNPKTRTFRNFDVSDGLPDNYFNQNSFYRRRGRLLFGSVNGFVVFHPDSIRDNPLVPPVYITGLKVLEKSRPVPTHQLELPHQENFLSFEFVALNYDTPEKNQYAYQLVGLDKGWINSGTRRFASYTDLAPGEYTFRVKASNNDGIWNEKGTSLTVIIRPPWWRTWWAYGFYGLLFVASVFALDRYQRRRLIEKERERTRQRELAQAREIEQAYQELGKKSTELEQQKEELQTTLEDLKATQAQLIQKEKMASLGELTAGIAHEIQNPLNFVNNFSEVSTELVEELKEGPMQQLPEPAKQEAEEILGNLEQNLSKIHHHGQRADSIVKGMLQHSRTPTGEKQLIDINALADEYLRLAYHGLRAKDKEFNASLFTDFDAQLAKVEVIPQEMGRVLLNLFNNAFYATQQKKALLNGQYEPQVHVSTRKVGDRVEIRVRDNGTGIPEKVKNKIFQPFFTTKPAGQGTGLGLSLSYDIITKGHGGELTVETKEGEFSEFILSLPGREFT